MWPWVPELAASLSSGEQLCLSYLLNVCCILSEEGSKEKRCRQILENYNCGPSALITERRQEISTY
jgi:hypothetical protein